MDVGRRDGAVDKASLDRNGCGEDEGRLDGEGEGEGSALVAGREERVEAREENSTEREADQRQQRVQPTVGAARVETRGPEGEKNGVSRLHQCEGLEGRKHCGVDHSGEEATGQNREFGESSLYRSFEVVRSLF